MECKLCGVELENLDEKLKLFHSRHDQPHYPVDHLYMSHLVEPLYTILRCPRCGLIYLKKTVTIDISARKPEDAIYIEKEKKEG